MMKCRLRESRFIAINEGERSLTAADVSAVYQINGDETKHSAHNRMLANSHAGRGTGLPSTWKLARPINTSAGTIASGLARHRATIRRASTCIHSKRAVLRKGWIEIKAPAFLSDTPISFYASPVDNLG